MIPVKNTSSTQKSKAKLWAIAASILLNQTAIFSKPSCVPLKQTQLHFYLRKASYQVLRLYQGHQSTPLPAPKTLRVLETVKVKTSLSFHLVNFHSFEHKAQRFVHFDQNFFLLFFADSPLFPMYSLIWGDFVMSLVGCYLIVSGQCVGVQKQHTPHTHFQGQKQEDLSAFAGYCPFPNSGKPLKQQP